ncbi:MAG: type I-E CRISPR-associated protein Cas7/Cse4/CasC [Thermodesulfobacteriota bacterium]|nr:type I-E CRISPR-associated protein Cas7/Cse4/CasC [Thermodesulfobacteriota bacterium]
MEKNFVNFHILISHSPSCLNRDDMNMQKSAVFGGKRRVRISSQSLKRTMRKCDYYAKNIGEASIRSRDLKLLKNEFLNKLNGEFEEAIIQEAIERFVKAGSQDDSEDQNLDTTDDTTVKKLAVAPWIKEEFRILCKIVKDTRDGGLSEDEFQKANQKFEKQKGKNKKDIDHFTSHAFGKKIENKIKEKSLALKEAIASALDVALSGRMATSGLMTTIDGALAVAHAITTHAVDADIDWFTAVDDLQELGSGHLDTQEFSSGVFYRYASLNLKQLQGNLGGAERKKSLEAAAYVLHMLATEVPSAKQQSFAAHNLADLAMVAFSDIPVSLANAFEEPVKASRNGGFLKPSISTFHTYWNQVHAGYGLDERCGEFILGSYDVPKEIQKQSKLIDLEEWVKADGKNEAGGGSNE